MLFSMDRQSSYMVRADELYSEVSQDPSGKAPSQGLFIGCFVDTSTGIVSFTCEGKETKQRFRMEPGTKLFPAVFVKATSKDALQVSQKNYFIILEKLYFLGFLDLVKYFILMNYI